MISSVKYAQLFNCSNELILCIYVFILKENKKLKHYFYAKEIHSFSSF